MREVACHDLLTHSLAHSFTPSLLHSFTHSLTQLPTRLRTRAPARDELALEAAHGGGCLQGGHRGGWRGWSRSIDGSTRREYNRSTGGCRIGGYTARQGDRQTGQAAGHGRHLVRGHGDEYVPRLYPPALLRVRALHQVVDHHALSGLHLLESDAQRLGQRHLCGERERGVVGRPRCGPTGSLAKARGGLVRDLLKRLRSSRPARGCAALFSRRGERAS